MKNGKIQIKTYGPKRFYFNDNGILFHLLGKLSYSSAFEQTLFSYLYQNFEDVGFLYENKKEVDFVVKNNNQIEFWEAKYQLPLDFEKKINSYLKLAKRYHVKKVTIVTKTKKEHKKIGNIEFIYTPL